MLNQHKIFRVLQLITYLQQQPHKSIQQIALFLSTTERTAYRYLDLIRECGFDLQRDKLFRFFPVSDQRTALHFTEEEALFLRQLVLIHGKRNKLRDGILSKIYIASEIQLVGEHLLQAKNGRIVERLAQAIATKEQVVLKRYHSINSESISDRLVEPFGFTDNYHTVMAFEIASQQNKTFNLDRITTVELTGKPFSFEQKHEKQTPDAFGFSENGKKTFIEIDLSLKASLLLKNAYPLTTPFITFNAKKDCYELKIEVNDTQPIELFLKGIAE